MKKWMRTTLLVVFIATFVASAGYLTYYIIHSNKEEKAYTALQEVKETNAVTPRPTINEDGTITQPETPPVYVDVEDPETGEIQRMLQDFTELYQKNSDIIGWIEIPGTEISYPVMQTPKNPNYYLKRNFEKEYSEHGCIYVQETCDVTGPSDNVTIYGHRMRDGSMFAQLDNYTKKEFWEANRYIYFDTLTELHTYEIIAVFTTTASVGKGFAYHEFVNAADEAGFNKYVSKCKDLALYDTGVDATYGDKLITLSTCEYSQINGRLVVVAKRLF